MKSALKPSRVSMALAFAACLSTSAGADLAKWDQARVTSIAQQLAAACEAWEKTAREQPGGGELGSGDARDYLVMQQRSRFLREQSASLAKHLQDGKGHDQTVHSYQALKGGRGRHGGGGPACVTRGAHPGLLGKGRRPAASDRALLRPEGAGRGEGEDR